MPSNRQLVLLPVPDEDVKDPSMGARREFLERLAQFNTAPDGSDEHIGIAFGPGFRVELPFVGEKDPITQALVTITEEDNAWPVLFRLCQESNWRLMDSESGRTFGF